MIPPSFLLLVQIGLTDCLLTPSRSTTTRIWPRQSAFRAQFLSSTTKAEETSSTSKYVTSLESLLKQQKAELRDTENLLELVKEASEGTKLNLDEDSSPAISTVASILSGFDYGFVSRSEGSPSLLKPGLVVDGLGYGGPPANILSLGTKQFVRNCYAIKGEYKDEEEVVLTPKQEAAQANLEQLTLNSTEIWEREFADGPIQAPWIIKAPYFFVCFLLDIVFEGRYVPSRFVLLETVARMPYFSYISMLHLYETLGFWRRSADMKRVHFAEEINEYRHLLIMESLGGDQSWWVRFVAQHSAIVYFYVLCGLWALSPSLSYRFSELLETHAVNTYGVFLDDNEELLKELPPSLAAVEYYSFGISDPFYAEFQTSALANGREIRRPGRNMHSLYDVFCAIQDDERDHMSTMMACLDSEVTVRSRSLEKKVLTGMALAAAVYVFLSEGEMSGVIDGIDQVGDVAASTTSSLTLDTAVDAALASAAGLTTGGLLEDEEGLASTAEAVEAGLASTAEAVEGLRRLGTLAVEVIEGFISILLLR